MADLSLGADMPSELRVIVYVLVVVHVAALVRATIFSRAFTSRASDRAHELQNSFSHVPHASRVSQVFWCCTLAQGPKPHEKSS